MPSPLKATSSESAADSTHSPDDALLAFVAAWHEQELVIAEIAAARTRDGVTISALVGEMKIASQLLDKIEELPAEGLAGIRGKFSICTRLLAQQNDRDALFIGAAIQEFIARSTSCADRDQ
jgi:hypothetical protein